MDVRFQDAGWAKKPGAEPFARGIRAKQRERVEGEAELRRALDGGEFRVAWETIGRDATEQREAMRRLRESAAYLSTVIETAPDAVVRMDESGTITDWNSAAGFLAALVHSATPSLPVSGVGERPYG